MLQLIYPLVNTFEFIILKENTAMEFIHNENQIVSYSDNGNLLAEITFPYIDSKTVNINHTFVDASLRGQGVAGMLMTELIHELENRNLQAIASCSYAAVWFEKHPQYSHLLR